MRLRSDIVMLLSPVLLLMFSDTTATNIDHALQYRQNVPVGTGATASAPASASPSNLPAATSLAPSPASPTPSPNTPAPAPPTSTASPTAAEPTTSDSANDSPSTSASTVPQSTSPGDNRGTSSAVQGSASADSQSTITSSLGSRSTDASKATQVQTKSVSSRTQQFLTTVVTVSGSSTHTNVFTTSGLVPVSTSTATSTKSPSLNAGDSDSSQSGLDSSQKRIVIGVVVGIGGAILLGGIAVVVWRIWGRKGHSNEEDNDLMDSHPGSSGREKRSSISGHSPFRSTLDQYHNHGGPVNTASNF
ncbi:MAG: hypothetical protein L6R39_001361 [Caloplaca ligustica]|nr:MAG: hypothetical protein L6R39_001361 [Caloplaca ligustica]